MSFEIRTLVRFDKNAKRLSKKYKSLKKDLFDLIVSLTVNPSQGADLGGGVRKVRMAISDKGRGKSGGARVITYTMYIDETSGRITMLTIYDKSEQDSISKNDINELLEELKKEEKEKLLQGK